MGDAEPEEVLRRRERVVMVGLWGFGGRRVRADCCRVGVVGEGAEHFGVCGGKGN